MKTDDEIVESCLGQFADEDADEAATWHFTDVEVRRLIILAIEAARDE